MYKLFTDMTMNIQNGMKLVFRQVVILALKGCAQTKQEPGVCINEAFLGLSGYDHSTHDDI